LQHEHKWGERKHIINSGEWGGEEKVGNGSIVDGSSADRIGPSGGENYQERKLGAEVHH